MNVLDTMPVVATLRRNHGVEHATIHVLASHVSPLAVAGHATLDGFNLFGEVITQDVTNAANEALTRLRNGESRLVIHPNCGTNFATAGAIVGAAAWVASLGRGTVSKLPRVIIASAKWPASAAVVAYSSRISPAVQSNRISTRRSCWRTRRTVDARRPLRIPLTSYYARGACGRPRGVRLGS